jgi:hypothetical protein
MALQFDVRDVFRAGKLGWNGKRMTVLLLGLVIAYVVYTVFTYLALIVAGRPFVSAWRTYDLYPYLAPDMGGIASWILYGIGLLAAVMIYWLAATQACRIAYQELKGDDFYSLGDAWAFMKRRWCSAVFAPISVAAIFVFLVICGLIVALVGRIPYVGELIFAVLLFPVFLGALLAVFVALVCLLSLFLTPAVVGTTGDDTLETVIQLFSTAWSQPWRLIGYMALLEGIVSATTALLATLVLWAYTLLFAVARFAMGPKLDDVAGVALTFLPDRFPGLDWLLKALDLFPLAGLLPAARGLAGLDGTVQIAGVLAGVGLWISLFFVASYAYAVYNAGLALIYLELRMRKDDENLLERHDEEQLPSFDQEEPLTTAAGPETPPGADAEPLIQIDRPSQTEGQEPPSKAS